MDKSGKAILANLLILIFLFFPWWGKISVSLSGRTVSAEDSFERHITSPGDGILLEIEWNNPFNPEASDPDDRYTRIYYKVREEGVTIRVYSINGELVRTLVEDKTGTEGWVDWDGRNDSDKIVGSGVYLVNLKVGKSAKTVKVVILK